MTSFWVWNKWFKKLFYILIPADAVYFSGKKTLLIKNSTARPMYKKLAQPLKIVFFYNFFLFTSQTWEDTGPGLSDNINDDDDEHMKKNNDEIMKI